MAEGSVPGALAHESPVFGLAESHATMNDAAGFLEQLAALFEEIGRDVAENSDERHLAALGAYYAREHTHMLRSEPGNMVDCAAFMKEAEEVFDRLEGLFQAIGEKVGKHTRASALAGVGSYTASDFANTIGYDCERAEEARVAEAARCGSKPGGRATGRAVEDPAQGEIDPVDQAPRPAFPHYVLFGPWATSVGISNADLSAGECRKVERFLQDIGATVLRQAREIGVREDEPPETHGNALTAVEFLLAMAQAFGDEAGAVERAP